MVTKFNLELKVGIFVFIALLILILAIFSISEIYIFRPGYYIDIYFAFASGIDVGAVVRVAGIEVGEVKDIELSYDRDTAQAEIILRVRIDADVQIPRDSVAFVNVLGLIGERYLEILPGQDYKHVLKDGDLLVGRDASSSETLMELVQEVADDFSKFLGSLNEVLDDETKLALKETIYNFRDFSGSLKDTTGRLDNALNSVNEVLDDQTKQALKDSIQNFRDVSANVKIITGRLERGEGKLGAWLKPKKSRQKTSKD